MASHFDFDGFANGYMPRGLPGFILLLMIVRSVAIVAINFALPRIAPRLLRIPARD